MPLCYWPKHIGHTFMSTLKIPWLASWIQISGERRHTLRILSESCELSYIPTCILERKDLLFCCHICLLASTKEKITFSCIYAYLHPERKDLFCCHICLLASWKRRILVGCHICSLALRDLSLCHICPLASLKGRITFSCHICPLVSAKEKIIVCCHISQLALMIRYFGTWFVHLTMHLYLLSLRQTSLVFALAWSELGSHLLH